MWNLHGKITADEAVTIKEFYISHYATPFFTCRNFSRTVNDSQHLLESYIRDFSNCFFPNFILIKNVKRPENLYKKEKMRMNYRHVYMQIISAAKSEQLQGLRKRGNGNYYEAHHILPKSLFPLWKNRKSNIVLLTPREHFFCHQLLTKIYPCYQMYRACMNFITRVFPDVHYQKITSKQYAILKENFSRAQRERTKNYWKNPEYREKVLTTRSGYRHSEETKKKMSEAAKGKKKSEAHRLALKAHSHMRKTFTFIFLDGSIKKFSKSFKDIAKEDIGIFWGDLAKASKYLDWSFGVVCLDKMDANVVFDHRYANIKSKDLVFKNPLTGEPISPTSWRVCRSRNFEFYKNLPQHPWNESFQERIENLSKEIENLRSLSNENSKVTDKSKYKEFFKWHG